LTTMVMIHSMNPTLMMKNWTKYFVVVDLSHFLLLPHSLRLLSPPPSYVLFAGRYVIVNAVAPSSLILLVAPLPSSII
jgi:hypothetical protein